MVWKDLEIHEGQRKLFDTDRCFFYITNDWKSSAEEIVRKANRRCNQENTIEQHKNQVRSLTAPLDNLLSNWAYMVMTSLAWSLKAWAALCCRNEDGEKRSIAQRNSACCGWTLPRSGMPGSTFLPQSFARADGSSIDSCPGIPGKKRSSASGTY